ncbi:hypothetical protein [Seonamhaeicola maritimus]|uniref:Uncharacterized protein n=1 Tax=Seonamhaeicola maritimus TaxID=2591822 RepID=A0A5C7GLP6_9FLAO|nr:hypothetical protein [Seonamhaeicola maritimus]TXG39416.1 hypothetical protein FUA22_05960 [Seonamhaeicola maritimus]
MKQYRFIKNSTQTVLRFYIFLGVIAPSFAQESGFTDNILIEIDPETVLNEISDDFIGFGYETSAVANKGLFNIENKHLVQLYKTLSKSGLVRIGGIIGDWTKYEAEGIPVGKSQKEYTIINKDVLNDLGAFLKETGWKVMWTINLGTGSKEEAVESALAVIEAMGEQLHSFEIGNEVSLLERFKDYEDYHKTYVEYKTAIREVLPNAKFSGADIAFSGNIQWNINFVEDESQDMSEVINHYYRGGSGWSGATIETLLSHYPKWNKKLSILKRLNEKHGVPFRMNEVGSFSGGGKAGVSDSFAASLWCLNLMFQVASSGGVGVNIQTDVNQLGFQSHYSAIYRNEDNTLSERPSYYGMLAFSLAGKGELLKLSTSVHELNLTAYATKNDEEEIWLTIINKDFVTNANIKIPLPPGYNKAEVFRLEAPSIESLDNVTLAGAKVDEDGAWETDVIEKLNIYNKTTDCNIRSGSAALIRLRKQVFN